MEMKLVSIIMSCYNEKIDWLIKSIDSILSQTYENIEFIIICDNPNNTEIIQAIQREVNKDKRIRFIINEKNLGLTKSLNKALSLSKGYYIARMDADDISFKNRIEIQVREMEKRKVDFLLACGEFIDEDGNVFYTTKSQKVNSKNIKKLLKYYNVSLHPTWIFKKDILKKMVEYKNIDYAEDYDFICRAILNDIDIGIIDENLIQYRVRKNGITSSKKALQEISFQIVNKNYRDALNYKKTYNAEHDLKMVTECEKNEYLEQHNSFKHYKESIYNKKYLYSLRGMIKVFINSKYKRSQIVNYFKFRLIKILI